MLSISVLIPTLNSAKVLERCLASIAKQEYPKNKIEIIVADAGSTDGTLEIIKKFEIRNSKFEIKVVDNPLKTAEAGKAVALRHAQGELVALIDSDNILPTKNWLKKMIAPFSDPQIIGSEPWKFTWRKKDGFIDRYCALIGMNDPLVMFLGNYDRLNLLTNKWTELEIEQKEKDGYIEIPLSPGLLPTIGANGTILRRSIFKDYQVKDYLFDIDVIYELAQRNTKKFWKFAKVKTSIIHLYSHSSILQFFQKQKRRVKDYLYYESLGVRRYPWRVFGWNTMRGRGLRLFIFFTLSIFPLLFQSWRGYQKKKDWAWFFHPLACLLTLIIYSYYWIARIIFGVELFHRK